MTLQELAQHLRDLAFNLEESHRRWAENEALYRRVQSEVVQANSLYKARGVEIERLRRQLASWKRRAQPKAKKRKG